MAFFFAAYFILADKITTTDTQALLLIGTAFGAVAAQAGSVVNYYFGTTKGSSDKDKVISDMKNQTSTATLTPESVKVTTGQQPQTGEKI